MYHLVSSVLLLLVLNPATGNRTFKNLPIVQVNYPTATLPTVFRDIDVGSAVGSELCKGTVARQTKFAPLSTSDTVGCTQYDHQWHVSPKARIIYDPVNHFIHLTYMKQLTTAGNVRHMFYNSYDVAASAWGWPGLDGGTAVQTLAKDGYGAIDIDPAGNAVVCLHRIITGTTMQTSIWIDAAPGMGSFTELKTLLTAPGSKSVIWPVIAVDGAGDMLVIGRSDSTYGYSHYYDTTYYSYCLAESISTGNWSAWTPITPDLDSNLVGNSYSAFASKIPGSQKMCMSWAKYINDDGVWNNHVFYRESQNGGLTWGSNKDITALITLPSPRLSPYDYVKNSMGSTYGIYDDQNNVHIVTEVGMGDTSLGTWHPSLSCVISHYSSEYDSNSVVAYLLMPADTIFKWAPTASWNDVFYSPSYGQFQSKPVVSEDPISKVFYVIWTEFPVDSYSIANRQAGEVFASYSLDKGKTWAPKMNLTMTPAICEVWPSMSPIVNDTLHILYQIDINGVDDVQYRLPAGSIDEDNKNPLICMNEPIKRGDIAVLSINGPTSDSLTGGDIVIPNVTYKNNGTKAVNFQARFEVNTEWYKIPIGATPAPDTLVTPIMYYYDVKNVTVPAGDTIQVAFKPWTVIGSTEGIIAGTFEAFATMLIDTALVDNDKDTTWVVKQQGIEEANGKSKVFTVSSTYPTPANGIASIKYSLPNASNVAVKVYDVTGKLVNTLVNENCKAGTYTTTWNGKNTKGNKMSTGLYFYRVEACSKIETRKIVLVK